MHGVAFALDVQVDRRGLGAHHARQVEVVDLFKVRAERDLDSNLGISTDGARGWVQRDWRSATSSVETRNVERERERHVFRIDQGDCL